MFCSISVAFFHINKILLYCSLHSPSSSSSEMPMAKVLLIGDSGVGKSCILLRYSDDSFSSSYVTTIGIDFKMKRLKVNDVDLKLQIWDTAGQERFRTITASYYRDAHGILLIYEVSSQESLENTRNWMRQIEQNCTQQIDLILVGNKSDSKDRVVSYEMGKELADEYGIPFFETSAKENNNIDECFQEMANAVYRRGNLSSMKGKTPVKLGAGPRDSVMHKEKSCC